MKKILILLFVATILVGCSDDDRLLKEGEKATNQTPEEQILKRDNILFGEKKGENKIEAKNKFNPGEDVNFYVKPDTEQTTESVDIILRKAEDDSWKEVTQSSLPIKGTWKEFMNGIPGDIFKKLGPGPYQLEIQNGGETIAKGKFVIEE